MTCTPTIGGLLLALTASACTPPPSPSRAGAGTSSAAGTVPNVEASAGLPDARGKASADLLDQAIALELRGDVISRRQALARYEAACRGGEPRGCFHFAELARTSGNPTSLTPPHAEALEASCTGGDMAACHELALTLDDDGGLPKDGERAFALYRRACDGGYLFACDRVAVFYRVSVPSNEPDAPLQALAHAWRACEAGLGHACFQAATIDLAGHLRPAAMPSAQELMGRACRQGDVFACTRLVEEAARNKQRRLLEPARSWLTTSCRAGHPRACTALANLGR